MEAKGPGRQMPTPSNPSQRTSKWPAVTGCIPASVPKSIGYNQDLQIFGRRVFNVIQHYKAEKVLGNGSLLCSLAQNEGCWRTKAANVEIQHKAFNITPNLEFLFPMCDWVIIHAPWRGQIRGLYYSWTNLQYSAQQTVVTW